MVNGAVQANGFTNTVTTDNHITARGSDWVKPPLPLPILIPNPSN